eukprot:2353069-Pyramimonas_sp.AAC.1
MRPPPPSTALAPFVSPNQHSASWPHGVLHRGPEWHRPHASATTQHIPCSLRFTHPVKHFVAP